MPLKKKNKVNPKELLKKNYVDSIQEDLEEKGVDFFCPEGSLNIDKDYLSLPQNITEVSMRDLGEYLNAFTQQKMYMRTLLGWLELLLEESKREYEMESAFLYKELSESKMAEKSKEREVNTHPKIRPFYEKFRDFANKCSLLEMNISSIEDAIFLLSREVSRRSGDFSNESRNYNVNK